MVEMLIWLYDKWYLFGEFFNSQLQIKAVIGIIMSQPDRVGDTPERFQ
jgi:hypothetical protein